jgi:hypothetical protein
MLADRCSSCRYGAAIPTPRTCYVMSRTWPRPGPRAALSTAAFAVPQTSFRHHRIPSLFSFALIFLSGQSIVIAMTTPNMSCPSGGTFWACGDGSRFVGCCASEPCSVGCPAGNLKSSSFDASQYGKIPGKQECGHAAWDFN